MIMRPKWTPWWVSPKIYKKQRISIIYTRQLHIKYLLIGRDAFKYQLPCVCILTFVSFQRYTDQGVPYDTSDKIRMIIINNQAIWSWVNSIFFFNNYILVSCLTMPHSPAYDWFRFFWIVYDKISSISRIELKPDVSLPTIKWSVYFRWRLT